MRRARFVYVVSLSAAFSAVCACGDVDDGAGVYVALLDDQPSTPELGVLVRVMSHGGERIFVDVARGTAVGPNLCLETPAEGAPCSCYPADKPLSLAIHPDGGQEALLTVVLSKGTTCTMADGDLLDSKQVPISLVGAPADAGVDAAESNDAVEVDASAGGG